MWKLDLRLCRAGQVCRGRLAQVARNVRARRDEGSIEWNANASASARDRVDLEDRVASHHPVRLAADRQRARETDEDVVDHAHRLVGAVQPAEHNRPDGVIGKAEYSVHPVSGAAERERGIRGDECRRRGAPQLAQRHALVGAERGGAVGATLSQAQAALRRVLEEVPR